MTDETAVREHVPGEVPPLVPGRACGGCTLCCKVLAIEALQKPLGTWCAHCAAGKGCRIYERRPQECRDYYCAWLTWPEASEAWRPSRAKIVLDFDRSGQALRAHVDPGRPGAWKAEPYYSQLKRWASQPGEGQRLVIVMIDDRAIVVLPDRDIDLGRIGPGETIATEQRRTPGGAMIVHAYKTKSV